MTSLVGLNCMLFFAAMKELNRGKGALCLGFYRLLGSGQWPGYVVRQECDGNLAC